MNGVAEMNSTAQMPGDYFGTNGFNCLLEKKLCAFLSLFVNGKKRRREREKRVRKRKLLKRKLLKREEKMKMFEERGKKREERERECV